MQGVPRGGRVGNNPIGGYVDSAKWAQHAVKGFCEEGGKVDGGASKGLLGGGDWGMVEKKRMPCPGMKPAH